MAVYKRTYRGYSGGLTPEWSRFLILTRYAYREMFGSRIFTAFFVACLLPPLVFAIVLYVNHNLGLLLQMKVDRALPIDGRFFRVFTGIEGMLAFLLTAFAGPRLISADLANNALPLYLCRPFSRAEYVLGKISVLLILCSLLTWVPGLLLFIINASLEGGSWWWSNLWIANAIFTGSCVWLVIISLMSLAISAWVRWKLAASALLVAIFFVSAGFAEAVNRVLRTNKGTFIDLFQLIGTVWMHLFHVEREAKISLGNAWISLGAICLFCLWLLSRRIRAFEVVK